MIELISKTHPVPFFIAIPIRISFIFGIHLLFAIFTFSTAFRMLLIFKVNCQFQDPGFIILVSRTTSKFYKKENTHLHCIFVVLNLFQDILPIQHFPSLRPQRSTTWSTRGCSTEFSCQLGSLSSSSHPPHTYMNSFSTMVSFFLLEHNFIDFISQVSICLVLKP